MEERRNEGSHRSSLTDDMLRLAGFLAAIGAALRMLLVGEQWQHISLMLFKVAGVVLCIGLAPAAWRHRGLFLKKCRQVVREVGYRVRGIERRNDAGPWQEQERTIRERDSSPLEEGKGRPWSPARGNDPFTLLPRNPRPQPKAAVTQENAGDWISSALQLVGFTLDQPVEILSIEAGPSLQTVSFRLPPKVQLSALIKKRDDLANHLGCHAGFDVVNSRFQSSASFVIPHQERAFVYLRDVMSDERYRQFAEQAELPVVLGADVLGNPLLVDLAKLPHLLVAGATGSGKSVFVNAILGSLLACRGPESLKLLLIDPKMVELALYRGFPHLIAPPVTDMRRAGLSLNKVIMEMERRYEVLAAAGTRNIQEYNRKHRNEKLPYMVVVTDEYADLMLVAGEETEEAVQRITQKARAAGIHLILATQRPSVDVVTGVIKANLPSRVAFRLLSVHDFKTVMDSPGLDLLGHGDGIAMLQGGRQQRFQSASISVDDAESTTFIEDLKQYWLEQSGSPVNSEMGIDLNPPMEENDVEKSVERVQSELDIETESEPPISSSPSNPATITASWEKEGDKEPIDIPLEEDLGELYMKAKALAASRGRISAELLKLQFGLTFVQASGLMYEMDEEGLLGEMDLSSNTRIWLGSQAEEKSPDEQLLDRMRYLICQTRSARSADLRHMLGVRKDKILTLMQQLVKEGMLGAYSSTRKGYTLIWTEEQIKAYLDENRSEDEE